MLSATFMAAVHGTATSQHNALKRTPRQMRLVNALCRYRELAAAAP
jgi:hypothetical protein